MTKKSIKKSTKPKKKEQFICLSTLKHRGWTDSIIKQFKLVPDKTVDNPYYSCASDMKLYKLKRIERLEKTEKFQEALKKVEKRREIGRLGAIRRQELFEQSAQEERESIINDTEFDFYYFGGLKFTLYDIIDEAIKQYDDYHAERGDYKYISTDWTHRFNDATDGEIAFLRRIILNYIRHCCTNYEQLLYGINYNNKNVMCDVLKEHIEEEAIKQYPELAIDKFGGWLREQGREAA